jgi:hypothetical protein
MMRVGLLNLGDAPRIFHNILNRAVVAPIGKVVIADLHPHTVQGLQFPIRPETVMVCEPDAEVPDEMQKIVDLLASIDDVAHEVAIRKFFEIAPPNNIGRPSRAQIRMALRTMVEDYIQEHIGGDKIIRDDQDPVQLEAEEAPIHPIVQAQRERAAEIKEQNTPALAPGVALEKKPRKQKTASRRRR